jgi:hypothetical protein
MKKQFSAARKFAAAFVLSAMLAPVFSAGANAQTMTKTTAKALTEDQKILHVLNRLWFRRALRRCRAR